MRACRFDRLADAGHLVGGEVVHDHRVTWRKRRFSAAACNLVRMPKLLFEAVLA